MSRQTARYAARQETKRQQQIQKLENRRASRRALLARQSLREKAGLYDERGVAQNISPSRSRISTRTVRKGRAFGRAIKKVGGWVLHATKGWRRA